MVSEKQIEAAADQISEGLGAFLRKFCDSEASKRARYYLHEMPKDEWNQMALMLATEALTAAEQAEPAPGAEPVHPTPSEARLREALVRIDALDPEGHAAGFSVDALRGLIERMGGIARAALKEASDERS